MVKRPSAVSARASATRGARALRRVLREETCDLRALDEAGFRRWLEQRLEYERRDPAFAQRVRIRDLRRSCPELRRIEQEYRRCVAADAAAPHFSRLSRLEQEVNDAERAIAGLSDACRQARGQRRSDLRQKLDAFCVKRSALQREQANLVRATPEREELFRRRQELEQVRAAIGLEQEEARLVELLRERGRRGGRAGQSFEQTAVELAHHEIMPDLRRHRASAAARSLQVLPGVTLGAARLEFDQLIVRQSRRPGQPVEVLAIVEVKRNINDLAHGFRRRQENLAWLTGEPGGYRAEMHRTRRFRSGHFDVEAIHDHEGESFVFTRRSFRLFRRDAETGLFLDRLYFITRPGPVWGLSSRALALISHRMATDEDWTPKSDAYLRRFASWSRTLADPLETPELLRVFAALPRRARQILLVVPDPAE